MCDSSTLILLARAGILGGIFHYVSVVHIPPAVFKEAVERGKEKGKEDALVIEREIESGRIRVTEMPSRRGVDEVLKNFHMDAGEAEAIALCAGRHALFLGTDDREAVKACRVYGIPFTTALAIAVKLAKERKISKERAALAIDKLQDIGFYSKEIMSLARKEAGIDGTSD